MRDFLFRAWKDNKRTGMWIFRGGHIGQKEYCDDILNLNYYLSKVDIIEQFANMYDCTKWEELTEIEQKEWLVENKEEDWHGKMIFEGDILTLINLDYETINVICEFGTARRGISENVVDINGFYFKTPNGRKTFPIVNNYLGKHDLEILKVIGNIHENPELLI